MPTHDQKDGPERESTPEKTSGNSTETPEKESLLDRLKGFGLTEAGKDFITSFATEQARAWDHEARDVLGAGGKNRPEQEIHEAKQFAEWYTDLAEGRDVPDEAWGQLIETQRQRLRETAHEASKVAVTEGVGPAFAAKEAEAARQSAGYRELIAARSASQSPGIEKDMLEGAAEARRDAGLFQDYSEGKKVPDGVEPLLEGYVAEVRKRTDEGEVLSAEHTHGGETLHEAQARHELAELKALREVLNEHEGRDGTSDLTAETAERELELKMKGSRRSARDRELATLNPLARLSVLAAERSNLEVVHSWANANRKIAKARGPIRKGVAIAMSVFRIARGFIKDMSHLGRATAEAVGLASSKRR
jgi:hypothetical protein